jgi:hypothetical protein
MKFLKYFFNFYYCKNNKIKFKKLNLKLGKTLICPFKLAINFTNPLELSKRSLRPPEL